MDQGHSTKQKGGHLKFRIKLADQLMAHSSSSKYASPVDGFGVRTNLENHVITSVNGCNGIHDVLSQTTKECKACMSRSRIAVASGGRKALQDQDGEKVKTISTTTKSLRLHSVPNPSLSKRAVYEDHIQTSKVLRS